MRWVVGERRGKERRGEEERGNIFPSGGDCAGVCWGGWGQGVLPGLWGRGCMRCSHSPDGCCLVGFPLC